MFSERATNKRFFRTIGFRLTLWGAGITIVVSALLCVTLYMGLSLSLHREVDGILEAEIEELTASIFVEHKTDFAGAQKDIRLELSHRDRGDLSFRLSDLGGNILVDVDPEGRLGQVSPAVEGAGTDSTVSVFQTIEAQGIPYPVRVCSRQCLDAAGKPYVAQAGYLLEHVAGSLQTFRRICLATLLLVAVLAVAGGRFIANRSLRPIQAMNAKAQRITARRLQDRLPRAGTGDELDCLAETLNSMLDRIQKHVNQIQQFTADASHELRSPLAALRGNAEVALSHDRSAAELRQVIEESIEEYVRLSRIAEDLLLLARADAGQLPLECAPLLLGKAVADVVDLYTPLAQDRDITMTCSPCEDIEIVADGSRLRRLLSNLIDNAIKYAGPGSQVDIQVFRENGEAVIVVRDNGPGIPSKDLLRVFDRFYRLERARSAQGVGGAGLGLAICRTIAEAHHGTIGIASVDGQGTFVTIRLPLAGRCPRRL